MAKKRKSPITADDVRQRCRSWKPTSEIAAELRVSVRTVERKIAELRAAGYTVLVKQAWSGGHKRSPHYRVGGRAAR